MGGFNEQQLHNLLVFTIPRGWFFTCIFSMGYGLNCHKNLTGLQMSSNVSFYILSFDIFKNVFFFPQGINCVKFVLYPGFDWEPGIQDSLKSMQKLSF